MQADTCARQQMGQVGPVSKSTGQRNGSTAGEARRCCLRRQVSCMIRARPMPLALL
jgi:hypothetical protein